jgi:thiol-disulfide isomerase/thioredoxin
MRRLVPVVVAAALLLAGCTSQDGIAGEDGGGYISGDGSVRLIAAGERTEVPDWGGETVDGDVVDSGDLDGVVVLNFWYAGCPPCRVEAPDLEAVYQEYGDRVTFLGVNVRDSAATAGSFEREFGVSYDSILDVSTRDVLSAFAGEVPPSAVPTTLVLDAQGRVAARISGQLPSATTLGDIVGDVLAED